MADRKVENLSPLKAEELRDCADTSVDIMCGLGREVYVAGLSAGGTLTAWIAQNRGEVTRTILIAPALGLTRREGTHLQEGMALLLPLLPDIRIVLERCGRDQTKKGGTASVPSVDSFNPCGRCAWEETKSGTRRSSSLP
jgi:hypothetical protein